MAATRALCNFLVKAPPNAVDAGDLVGCPGGGQGNPVQYSGLGNSMDTGAWVPTVHGVTKSQT